MRVIKIENEPINLSPTLIPNYACLWLPSHSGCDAVNLQPQKNTFLDSVAVNLTGENSDPL
jgi:hypothetical protein